MMTLWTDTPTKDVPKLANPRQNTKFVSVILSIWLSWTVCVCHGQSVSVIDSLCLSQTLTVCDRHRQSLSVHSCNL